MLGGHFTHEHDTNGAQLLNPRWQKNEKKWVSVCVLPHDTLVSHYLVSTKLLRRSRSGSLGQKGDKKEKRGFCSLESS